MPQLVLVAVCLLAGVLLRGFERLPVSAAAALNGFVIYLSLPALTLLKLHDMTMDSGLAYPVATAWVVIGLAIVFFIAVGRWLGWDRRLVGTLILTCGFGNTAFIGYAMVQAFYGPSGMPVAVVVDQMGTFIALATVGIVTATIAAARALSTRTIVKRILFFPPFIALLAALLSRGYSYPPLLTFVLENLMETMTPIALVSIGFQLTVNREALRTHRLPLAVGLGFKLLLAPLLVLVASLGARHPLDSVTVLQMAMPPLVTGAILSDEYALRPALGNLAVGLGIPLSFVTLPLWVWVLAHL